MLYLCARAMIYGVLKSYGWYMKRYLSAFPGYKLTLATDSFVGRGRTRLLMFKHGRYNAIWTNPSGCELISPEWVSALHLRTTWQMHRGNIHSAAQYAQFCFRMLNTATFTFCIMRLYWSEPIEDGFQSEFYEPALCEWNHIGHPAIE